MSNRLIALILAALAAGCGGGGDLTAPGASGPDPLPGPSSPGAPAPGPIDPGTPSPPNPGGPQPPPPSEPPAPTPVLEGRGVFAVDLENRLMLFGTGSPEHLSRLVPITGLGAGHRVVSVDFRGETGGLYGVGTDSRLYAIDTVSGVANPVGAPFHPELSGTHFGVTIDGESNRVWIHGVESDQNIVLRATTGELLSVDAPLAFGSLDPNAGQNPGVAGTAMRPSDGKLFGIEANKDLLVRLPEPALGTLATVGALGTGTTLCVGFDIAEDGAAFAALTQADGSKLHSIDLETGAATLIGTIAIDSPVQGIAIVPGLAPPAQPRVAGPVHARRVELRPAVAPPACFDAPGE
jgi:hypothetical protein